MTRAARPAARAPASTPTGSSGRTRLGAHRRGAPTGLPLVLVLPTREHVDAGEIDDDQASEFGRISNRLVRIIEGLPEHRPRARQPVG